ncbi:cyclopropane-fatty-acyl-phospholipid synthase family protein [uncultured Microbulbifer sp.]|uniref:SAM-dependent methyltransferase n=1 Tax=uncultured Microbulbifer sp. TaxID=348147 RepID=UPI0025E2D02B|nr:cyclopropane-fatty-acyl-phospholipid synthase family protein [uncultured Microbulbifer sp.]
MKSMNQAILTGSAPSSQHWLTRLARKLVLRKFRELETGCLVVEELQGGRYTFGQPEAQARIHAKILVRDQSLYAQVLLNGSIGAGESFMQGAWSSPDLVAVVRLMVANMSLLDDMDSRWSFAHKAFLRVLHQFNSNSKNGSRRNIAAHYDLGNDFFKLFLDPTMLYSSAVFPTEAASLHQASLHKLEKICEKLQLTERDHLLEIGTGWGGMAVHAAKHYGCRVTTTTISREQYEYAKAWVEKEGLEKRVTLLMQDYRDLEGQFDKIVSIEMVEAVGYQYYRNFFSRCSRLLKDDGLMVMQAITIQDQRFHSYRKQVDFIQRYIFPGGCLPSNQIIAHHVAADTDMQIVALEDITHHYARTLRAWREAFFNNIEAVRRQDFDESFINMWDFYLCYCEGGFLERVISTAQFVFAKPHCLKREF